MSTDTLMAIFVCIYIHRLFSHAMVPTGCYPFLFGVISHVSLHILVYVVHVLQCMYVRTYICVRVYSMHFCPDPAFVLINQIVYTYVRMYVHTCSLANQIE